MVILTAVVKAHQSIRLTDRDEIHSIDVKWLSILQEKYLSLIVYGKSLE